MEKVTVIGAGLVGSLLAIFLRRRGYGVDVFEQRSDPRTTAVGEGRSINLILTARGLHALNQVGLLAQAEALCVPVYGRMMHSIEGNLTYQPYGLGEGEFNRSISRGALNCFLIEQAEQQGAKFHFSQPLKSIDWDAKRLQFATETSNTFPFFGTDGVASVTRSQMVGETDCTELIDHGYKELTLSEKRGEFQIDGKALHIWPRGRTMLMALPNIDKSFTLTLYLPMQGEDSFEALNSPQAVQALFKKYFPDITEKIPGFENEFMKNPTGRLGSVFCSSWVRKDLGALVGDAAHGIVPFFGQGMNSGFEDCVELDALIEKHNGDWGRIFERYQKDRKANTDAIAEMALENFVEMRDRVGDKQFLKQKRIEHGIEEALPHLYRSRYALVTYSLVPYAKVQQIGEVQKTLIREIAAGVDDENAFDPMDVKALLETKLTPLLDELGVDMSKAMHWEAR